MMFKRNMTALKYGSQVSLSPSGSMFLANDNTAFGWGDTPRTAFELMNQPINRRDWMVYRDAQFCLSSPATQDIEGNEPVNASTMKYPVRKMLNWNIPIMKKCRFKGPLTNRPENIDTQYMIVIQSVIEGYQGYGENRPKNYVINLAGTTSALDN